MELPKILPKLTDAKVAGVGFLNRGDIGKLVRNFLIFLSPIVILYGVQLTGALSEHTVLKISDVIPGLAVIGAFEAHIIGTVLDYLRKLNDSK